MDFKVGDVVVYPTHGLGQVQAVEDLPMNPWLYGPRRDATNGMVRKAIVVTFDQIGMTLRIPVDQASPSGLRHLSTPKTISEVREVLRGWIPTKRSVPRARRLQENEQKINSGDPLALAEVVRDLHYMSDQSEQFTSEKNLYWQALHKLAAEFAAVEGVNVVTASADLLELLPELKKAPEFVQSGSRNSDEGRMKIDSRLFDLESENKILSARCDELILDRDGWQARALAAETIIEKMKSPRSEDRRYSSIKKFFAKELHPDSGSANYIDRSTREAVFKRLWPEIEKIDQEYKSKING